MLWSIARDAAGNWSSHKDARQGAALAYYSVFSIGPIIVIAIAVAGLFFGREAVSGQVAASIKDMLGDSGAKAVEAMLADASRPREGMLATFLGIRNAPICSDRSCGSAQGRLKHRLGSPGATRPRRLAIHAQLRRVVGRRPGAWFSSTRVAGCDDGFSRRWKICRSLYAGVGLAPHQHPGLAVRDFLCCSP